MAGDPRVFGIVEMRRLDAPHPRGVRRMRFLEVIDLVIGGDRARVVDKPIRHPAQSFDLCRLQNVGEHDEPVAAIGGEGSW
jgi:hypothetical protein